MLKITLTLAALLAVLLLAPAGRDQAAPTKAQTLNTFTLDNYSTFALGDVTISGAGGQTEIQVPGQGSYDTTIGYEAASVTVNGNAINYPDSAVVALSDGSKVKVGWQAPDLVDVGNEEIVNTPVQ